jgi:hypothetical protein
MMNCSQISFLCLLVASCSSDDGNGTQEVVPGAAVLAGVGNDQANVASHIGAQRQLNGSFLGPLQVSAVGGGAAQMLDAQATGATWARGTTLYYLAGAHEVTEGTPVARPRGYGALTAWLPTQASPVTLGATVGAFTVSQDGSAVAFIDRDSASSAATGTVKVWSTSLCSSTCGDPITVAGGVTTAALEVSNDGKHMMIGVPKVGTNPPQILLVSFPGGTIQPLSSDTTAHTAMMSADGVTVAWIEGGDRIITAPASDPTQTTILTVSTTGDPAMSPALQSAVMADATHFVARVKVGTTDPALYLVTSDATTPLGIAAPLRFAAVQQTPSDSTVSGRYLFYATAQDAQTGAEDLWVVDLQNPASAPIQLAVQTTGNPVFSDDGTMVRFLDNEDLDTTVGDLYVAGLPGGAPVLVSSGVRQAAFEPGTTTLLIQSGVDATGVGSLSRYQSGAMPTTGRVIPGVADFQIPRSGDKVLYYTQELGTMSDGVYRTDLF